MSLFTYKIVDEASWAEIITGVIGLLASITWIVLIFMDVDWRHFVAYAAFLFTWYASGRRAERGRMKRELRP